MAVCARMLSTMNDKSDYRHREKLIRIFAPFNHHFGNIQEEETDVQKKRASES